MIKDIQERFGSTGFIRILCYPITTLFTTPWRLIQSLWNARVLLKGRWGDFPHFTAHKSLNSLFYWNRALNLKRFGRAGKSPYLGLGDYNLGRCFHYSLPSLYLYWWAPTILLLLGMATWLAAHFIFLIDVDVTWLMLGLGLTLISTEFYSQVFNQQNYNVLGWAFFPLFLFAVMHAWWGWAAGFLLLISWGSFTVVVLGGMLLALMAVVHFSFWPLLAGIPAGLKLATHFLPLFKGDDGKQVLESVMKAIGMTRKKVRYVRVKKGKKLSLSDLYRMALILQFCLAFYWFDREVPILLLFVLGIYILNGMLLRFADEQSVYMLGFSAAVVTLLSSNPEPILLISFWLLVSPIPLLAGYYYDRSVLDVVPLARPFDIREYRAKMSEFIAPVPAEEKVYMAFEDPGNVYEKVFDGYRQLVELPAYQSSVERKLFFPEWWGVFELNYEGAPQIWGREPETVKTNLAHWKSNFVIIYQTNSKELDGKWKQHGFSHLGTFHWSDFEQDFKDHKHIRVEGLTWFLLSKEK